MKPQPRTRCPNQTGMFRRMAAATLFFALLTASHAAEHQVDIVNFEFVPDALTIQVGDTVTWTQKDPITHTTTSGPNGVADGIWDSGNMTLSSNTTFSFTFTEPGTYPYYCIPHKSFMRATIVVESSAPVPINNPIPEPLPAGDLAVRLVPVATGMVAPIGLVEPNDDSNRLFVHDQVGLVHIIQDGGLLAEPLLDARPFMVSLGLSGPGSYDERGLLGFTVHPDFPQVPKVYTHTSEPAVGAADFDITPPAGQEINHHSVFTEWTLEDGNPNRVDPTSRRVFLRVAQPQFNHNGGSIHFGTDGLFYLSLGDGGGADDVDEGSMFGHGSEGNGQNPETPLGAILRIDIDGNDSANGMYGIPSGNPFVGEENGLPEIYAIGFRNPFAFHFDPPTSLLFVGDVGQNDIEEIDVLVPGGNYGWNLMEGSFFFYPNGEDSGFVSDQPHPDLPTDLTGPIAQYDHDEGLAVVGGVVYRGSALPILYGRYITGDWGKFNDPSGRIFYLDDDLQLKEFQPHPDGQPFDYWLKGIGQDNEGEIYLLTSQELGPGGNTGTVFKFQPVLPQITGISAQGEDILLTWADHSGPVTIQHAAAPNSAEWSDITNVEGDSIAIAPPTSQGFLRVIEQVAEDSQTTRVILTGAAERPNVNPTSAVGLARVTVQGNTLDIHISYRNLSAAAAAAHIHGAASVNQTAGPIINLASLHQGEFSTQGEFSGSVELEEDQKDTILSGQSYINIHTSNYSGGEIRGQIIFSP